MASLYLFCLIIGGGLLLFSLLGHDGDTPDSHLDVAGDVDASADIHVDDHAGILHGDGWGLAKDFLSIRSLFYFLAGFGATGFLLEAFLAVPSGVALLWALVTGALAALAAGTVYSFLKRSESGVVPGDHLYLVGLPAQVVLPVESGHRGKVRLISGGREVELLARLYGPGDPDCPRGATVVIVDIEGDTALVTPAPSLPSDLS